MRKYFKGIKDEEADGWLLAVVTGTSSIDNESWVIDTNSLHADQVPSVCNDAKFFSCFVSGLLNAYYNEIETKGLSEDDLIDMGTFREEESIPSPLNPEIPF